jgi:hypothetical protein
MPLHDWSDDRGWDSVHQLWINALLFWLQERLPAGYHAHLGSVPGLSPYPESARPEVSVRNWGDKITEKLPEPTATVEGPEPDFHAVALYVAEPPSAVHILFHGHLVAAIELVAPRNKDRVAAREFYRNRYLGYLLGGVHLLLVDVHRRPVGFSFVEVLAAEMQCRLPGGLPPHALSCSVGGATPEGGRVLDGWHRQFGVGDPLPGIPLAVAADRVLLVDLERTYTEAAHRAYLV